MKTFNELRLINVNEHTERKGNLTYLSWTYALDILLQNDFRDPLVHIKPGDIRFSSELVLNPSELVLIIL